MRIIFDVLFITSKYFMKALTHGQCFHFIPKVFWYFHGVKSGNTGQKWVKELRDMSVHRSLKREHSRRWPMDFFCIWLQNNLEIPQYSTICLSVWSKKHARRRHVTGTQSYSENLFRVIRGISAEKRIKLMSELNRSCCSTKNSHWENFFSVAFSFDKTLVQLKWKN